MKTILSILLGVTSLSALAQHNNPFDAMPAHLKAIFEKQMSKQVVYKTTGSAQRLVGYSKYSFPGNTMTDTMHASFSGGRGDAFRDFIDNLYASGGSNNSQPDAVWETILPSNFKTIDREYLYDNQNHAVKTIDHKNQYNLVQTYDNAGDAILTKWYDTAMTYRFSEYTTYDNQHRKVYDSVWHSGIQRYVYGANGADSGIILTWNNTAGAFRPFLMDVELTNTSGQLAFHYQYLGDTITNSWQVPTSRDSLVCNSYGFITKSFSQNYYNGQWNNTGVNVSDYSGSSSIPNYLGYFSIQNNVLVGQYQTFFTLNGVGNWTGEVRQNWNTATNSWWTSDSININYNTNDLVALVNTFRYDTSTHQYQAAPSAVETYYYEEYDPQETAVTTIQTTSPGITAYPNPVSGKLHVDGNIGSKNVSMQIIGITGVRLFNASGNWQSMNKDIDMSSFANGVYYLLITDNNGNKIAAKQIVKN
ncbi:T9SS type A sorting domain-containing protein [Taibaiella soli]|uniref:Secretion system C-terminal sorting domain-containing protein n=1 Tax=Taibaiella soli TaxID=1649169 RepID=A0A2W2C342_9BACT|nr:T9SS type A sorting domain-containing protein [Taibaiella soli]PZF74523.1 hypothetical protein DN068_02810 [Taibaiella soli]